MFMDKQVTAKRDVGLIVSLIDPKHPIPIQTDWEDWDAEFACIAPKDARQAFGEFQKVVTKFIATQPKRCIAVFCEDGFNLTGYCIVSYIHQAYKIGLDTALRSFATARDPGIYHKPYLDDLHELFGGSRAPPPPWPSWAPPTSALVPPHGLFALPASRPRLSTVDTEAAKPPAAPAPNQLPAGWTEHWSKTHNKKYYFCKATGKQSWDIPTTPAPTPAAAGLPRLPPDPRPSPLFVLPSLSPPSYLASGVGAAPRFAAALMSQAAPGTLPPVPPPLPPSLYRVGSISRIPSNV